VINNNNNNNNNNNKIKLSKIKLSKIKLSKIQIRKYLGFFKRSPLFNLKYKNSNQKNFLKSENRFLKNI